MHSEARVVVLDQKNTYRNKIWKNKYNWTYFSLL